MRYNNCTHSNFKNEHLKDFLNSEYSGFYDFALVHLEINPNKENHVCYAIMQNRQKSIPFICVILIHISGGEIYYKEITEDMGPSENNCPVELFKFVECPDSKFAREWREECIKNDAKLNRVQL